MDVLSVEKLAKTYESAGGSVQALKSISFTLKKGELIAVMGTSGSGKSTLLNILGALDEPTSGRIVMNGQTSAQMFREPYATDFRRDHIGFIFQSFHLLKDLTVEENIGLPLLIRDHSKEEIRQKTAAMVELMGLREWRHHRPVQLSGGQQQRVAIGRALITEPPIILADELTGNLDTNTSNDILRVLTELKEKLNQSMLVVTHDPNVATYADRVLFFHDGEMVSTYTCKGTGDMEEIMQIFQTILGGRTHEVVE
ncbi:ABC transporter ATP-binding protein [Sporosarcina sp. Te-1]|uniref:ABC transporter ATP-binding protein n=1 Tax=Sporosarcina sp. Te-1 TaxID=2818390 RepID=UPI001A9F5A64|nr:ABC transporter ATP-binding protein [Sporosarcina sp. Te-1]QTD43177.1 ABC transporter ATP-binding protein [Sporosarcina sp. Te-1]